MAFFPPIPFELLAQRPTLVLSCKANLDIIVITMHTSSLASYLFMLVPNLINIVLSTPVSRFAPPSVTADMIFLAHVPSVCMCRSARTNYLLS